MKEKEGELFMLTDMQIAVIGGDARQLEVIRKLTELDAKLSLIGFEQLDHAFTGATKENIEDLISFNRCHYFTGCRHESRRSSRYDFFK